MRVRRWCLHQFKILYGFIVALVGVGRVVISREELPWYKQCIEKHLVEAMKKINPNVFVNLVCFTDSCIIFLSPRAS